MAGYSGRGGCHGGNASHRPDRLTFLATGYPRAITARGKINSSAVLKTQAASLVEGAGAGAGDDVDAGSVIMLILPLS